MTNASISMRNVASERRINILFPNLEKDRLNSRPISKAFYSLCPHFGVMQSNYLSISKTCLVVPSTILDVRE